MVRVDRESAFQCLAYLSCVCGCQLLLIFQSIDEVHSFKKGRVGWI
jgi:hypothetical protein